MENVNHLRQILALAETGNYRKAGERLGVSHSAISQTVGKLESLYEVSLFEKHNGETIPTTFGLRVIRSAKSMLMELERASRDLKDLEDKGGGDVTVGVDPTLCESLVGPAIAQTIAIRPNLTYKINITPPGKELTQLREKRIDLFIGLKPDEIVSDIKYTAINLKPPAVLCRRDHPLAARDKITLADMEPYPCTCNELPEWLKTDFNNRHVSSGGPFDVFRTIFLISQSSSLARHVLMYGENTLAVIPKEVVKRELRRGEIKELQLNPPIFRDFVPGVIAVNHEHRLSPAGTLLTDVVQNMTSTLK